MKKIFLITLIMLGSAFAFCQFPDAKKNYEKGSKALDSKNYKDAISFLTLSIQENPLSPNAFYNRACAFYFSGDTCSFCKDLKSASNLNDRGAQDIYTKKCKRSSILYQVPDSLKRLDDKITHLEKITYTCSSDSIIYAYREENSNISSVEISLVGKEIYTIVEEMPTFPGGDNARQRFLGSNIFYPVAATTYRIQGTVYIQFVIDTDGNVTNVKILRGIGGGCDEEAVRVVKLMPKWIPGKQNGKAKNVLFNMPIYFKLQG